MLFYSAVAKVYDKSLSGVADKIFGYPYSIHLRYEVGHDDRWPSLCGLFWQEMNKYFLVIFHVSFGAEPLVFKDKL